MYIVRSPLTPSTLTLMFADTTGWPLQVELLEMLGAERLVYGRLGDAAFTLRMEGILPPPQPGSTVQLQVQAQQLHWFDSSSGQCVV